MAHLALHRGQVICGVQRVQPGQIGMAIDELMNTGNTQIGNFNFSAPKGKMK